MAPHLCLMCCLCLQPPSMSSTNIPGAFVIRENMASLTVSPLASFTIVDQHIDSMVTVYILALPLSTRNRSIRLHNPNLHSGPSSIILYNALIDLSSFPSSCELYMQTKVSTASPFPHYHSITPCPSLHTYSTYDHHKHHFSVSPSLQMRIWSTHFSRLNLLCSPSFQ